ncbi:MAG: hypothetical protein AAF214_09105 [Pseudomonadota bacterium]
MRILFAYLCAVFLGACAPTPATDFELPLRNPTVPIGAITRFDLGKFAGDWVVRQSGGGAWALSRFSVSPSEGVWREADDAGLAQIDVRAPGILRLRYLDGFVRDVWVVWIDPDHQTAALGSPDGAFGFVVTRPNASRADQVTAARQVLDFNGYRTAEWKAGAQ